MAVHKRQQTIAQLVGLSRSASHVDVVLNPNRAHMAAQTARVRDAGCGRPSWPSAPGDVGRTVSVDVSDWIRANGLTVLLASTM